MTPEQLEEARSLVIKGATYAEIAERMSLSPDAVQSHLSADGVLKERRRLRNDKIFEMLQEGKTTREISVVIGLTFAGTRNITSKMRKYAKQK